jgi:hypothetical protein
MAIEDEKAANAQLQRAISRWEGEGGALRTGPQTESDEKHRLAADELRILQALGASVLLNWGTLPTATRKALFDGAVSSGHPADRAAVKERIARFLHEHKDHQA